MLDIKVFSSFSDIFVSPLFPKEGDEISLSIAFSSPPDGVLLRADSASGYLWSYPLVSAAGGFLCRAAVRARNRWVGIAWTVLSLLPGVAVCYALGTLQYCLLTGVTFLQGLAVCVIPFLPFDLIKCLAASVIGILLAGRGILPLPGRSRSASR